MKMLERIYLIVVGVVVGANVGVIAEQRYSPHNVCQTPGDICVSSTKLDEIKTYADDIQTKSDLLIAKCEFYRDVCHRQISELEGKTVPP